jgi:hypothetical protein
MAGSGEVPHTRRILIQVDPGLFGERFMVSPCTLLNNGLEPFN